MEWTRGHELGTLSLIQNAGTQESSPELFASPAPEPLNDSLTSFNFAEEAFLATYFHNPPQQASLV